MVKAKPIKLYTMGRKVLLSFSVALFFSAFVNAGPVPRKLVLIEKWSGTWCQPCTGAARALEQMDQENLKIAVLSYQIEKSPVQKEKFETEEGLARGQYYGSISGYPTTYYDGVLKYDKGNSFGTIYPDILPLYNERIALSSAFGLCVSSLDFTSEDSWKAKITVSNVDGYVSDKVRLRVAVAEKHIPEHWNGMEYLHYVQRDMYPDHAGTPVDTSLKEQTIEIEGNVNEAWNREELELIVFLQDDGTKEVLQTVSYPLYRKIVQPKGSRTINFNEVEYYWYTVNEFDDELDHYNVYSAQGELIQEVAKESNTFKTTVSEPGEYSVQVSAVYKNEGETRRSGNIDGKSYRASLAGSPVGLSYTGDKESGITFNWKEPYDTEEGHLLYSGHNELETDSDGEYITERKGGSLMSQVWVVYRFLPEDAFVFRGMDLTEVSFIPGDVTAGYTAGVFINGKLVREESVDRQGLQDGKWFTHKFMSPLFMTGKDTVDIGYRIKDLRYMPILIDMGPVIEPGKTNLIGVPDSKGIYTYKELYDGNNIIKCGFGIDPDQGTVSSQYELAGYNIYKDGVLLNAEIIEGLSYTAKGQELDGKYCVTALYGGGIESVPSNPVQIGQGSAIDEVAGYYPGIRIFAKGREVCIDGDFCYAELFDLNGICVAKTKAPVSTLRVDAGGVYLIKISAGNNRSFARKLVVM